LSPVKARKLPRAVRRNFTPPVAAGHDDSGIQSFGPRLSIRLFLSKRNHR
jgi:hypothetical protein